MRGARIAVLLGLLACRASPTPFVILRIEDPLGAGAQATVLVLTDAAGNTTNLQPAASGFPMTLTLTSERRGPQLVTIDLYWSTILVVRGRVTVDVVAQSGQEVALPLDTACVGTNACSHPGGGGCSAHADCDDGILCNGQESCNGGTCVAGVPACPEDRCGSDGTCTVTQPCGGVGDAACDDGVNCNGSEACVGGTCVAGSPPTLDGGTACVPVVCSEHFSVGRAIAADGASCLENDQDGLCYAGQCNGSASKQCYHLIDFSGKTPGNLLGGEGNQAGFAELTFPSSDPDGYSPVWRVAAGPDGGTQREIQPNDGNATQFTMYVKAGAYLASVLARSADGSLCRVVVEPTVVSTDFVTVMSYATVELTGPPAPLEQHVHFTIECPDSAFGASNLRITDVCLLKAQ